MKLQNIRRRFGHGDQALEILRGVDFELKAGEIVALLGPSGSGKTTLLQIAGLLEPPSDGLVEIDGKAANRLPDAGRTALRRDAIGYVFQFHNLMVDFTALENVMIPQQLAGKSAAAAKTRAVELLTSVGLKERLHHLPAELSGGEQQRVAIARALANSPKVLLADEPTGNLDEQTAEKVMAIFLEQARENGVATLVATHNTELAKRMDRRVAMHDGVLHPLP